LTKASGVSNLPGTVVEAIAVVELALPAISVHSNCEAGFAAGVPVKVPPLADLNRLTSFSVPVTRSCGASDPRAVGLEVHGRGMLARRPTV
jgi:hypothetical protein